MRMTLKEFNELQEQRYLNMLLWDFWNRESKWLCKHGYHNWQLMNHAQFIRTVEDEDPYVWIVRNTGEYKLKAVCHCCGKELEIYDDTTND